MRYIPLLLLLIACQKTPDQAAPKQPTKAIFYYKSGGAPGVLHMYDAPSHEYAVSLINNAEYLKGFDFPIGEKSKAYYKSSASDSVLVAIGIDSAGNHIVKAIVKGAGDVSVEWTVR